MKLDQNASIVVLTGAGISKESGLDTFRDENGVWSKVRIEDVATPDAYITNPDQVHEFYNMRRAGVLDENLHPNAAHIALVRLEQQWLGNVLIVTQNVDDLHERCGTKNLIHMHGELLKSRCTACGDIRECRQDLTVESICTACTATGTVRPHIVWFGEMPMQMDDIHNALSEADLFISIGTSGNVYPAAGFVDIVRSVGAGQTVELNLEPSEGATHFHDSRYGPATEIVPAFVNSILEDV